MLRGASSVAESGSRALERGKLRATLFRLEDEKKDKLFALGEICYRLHCQKDGDFSPTVLLCDELDSIGQEIEDLHRQLDKPDSNQD